MKRPYRALSLVLLLMACLLTAPGCDDDTTEGPDAARPGDVQQEPADDLATDSTEAGDVAEDVVIPFEEGDVRFDLSAAQSDDFFAFPYPSDLRRDERGAPDLTSFPTGRGIGTLLAEVVELVEGGSPGFSPLGAVYFGFHRSIDPAASGLPGDPTDSLDAEATVFLVDVTPGSPSYGQRHPIRVRYNDEGGGYWAPRTLALRPLYGVPLRPATTYAAVLTRDIVGTDGEPLEPPSDVRELEALLAGASGGSEVAESLRPLHDALPDLGMTSDDILAATVFTTSDPVAELAALRSWMLGDELDAPVALEVTLTEDRDGFTVYEGHFHSVEVFSGEAPYLGLGEGLIAVDDDGRPEVRTDVELTFAVSVPDGDAPDDGWPIVFFGHGLGDTYAGFIRVAAGPLAERGVAVLGLSPPLQGERNPTEFEDRDLIVMLSVNNIVAGREILRQGVLDEVRAVELVTTGGLEIPAEVSASGEAIHFDPARMGFLGHSEGAQIGALLLGVEPELGVGVFTAGGGGGAITMLALELPEIDVAEVVARVIGIDPSVETFDLDHPVVTTVIQPLLDVADPLHTARRIVREPESGGPTHLVMTEGFNDPLTPPASTEALASAVGLPIAEPVGRSIEGLDVQGIGSVALPARDNLTSSEGDAATGALLQFPDAGHYILYTDEAIRYQLFEFLASALAGEAELPAPPSD